MSSYSFGPPVFAVCIMWFFPGSTTTAARVFFLSAPMASNEFSMAGTAVRMQNTVRAAKLGCPHVPILGHGSAGFSIHFLHAPPPAHSILDCHCWFGPATCYTQACRSPGLPHRRLNPTRTENFHAAR